MSNQENSATPEQNPEHAAAQPEVMPSLEEMLQAAELKSQEHYDAWMYAKAETENIRRRGHQEAESARKYAVEGFSGELLAVKDALEAALATENASLESLKSGVELTLKQLSTVFSKFQIQEVNPIGEKFDPHQHQAMAMVEADAEPNTVVMVMQKGYALHGRILRPALVSVAKAPGT
jgi:molecular chaperone GrpE